MNAFRHISAGSVGEAVSLLATPTVATGTTGTGTRIIAGGTDLLTLMQAGLLAPQRLVDLKTVPGLRYVRLSPDETLHIGSLATLADLERSVEVARRFPILQEAIRVVATPQLRAMATVAGNLLQRPRCWYFRGPHACWLKGDDQCPAALGDNRLHAILGQSPCVAVHPSDVAPVLMALDAEVTALGSGGPRTIALEELFTPPQAESRIEHRLDPEEVITEISVPCLPAGGGGAYTKTMARGAWAFALASAAVQLGIPDGTVSSARIVLGGVATIPWRARQAEQLLLNERLTPGLAQAAARAAVAGATPLPHNAYKVALAVELVRRTLLRAGGLE